MERRTFLTGISASAGLLAGCLASTDDDTRSLEEGTNDEDDDSDESDGCATGDPAAEDGTADYERCPHRIVRISDLPAAAETQALAAIEDGRDEFDGEPLLPDVISVDDAFLLHENSYYRVELTETENHTQICLTEELPIFAESVVLENWMDTAVTVDVHIEHEETNKELVTKTVDLDGDDHITLNDDVDFPYGTYEAEFDGDDLSEEGAWDISWELNWAYETDNDYPVQLDDHGVFVDPVARNSMFGPCSWDDDGDVSTGDYYTQGYK